MRHFYCVLAALVFFTALATHADAAVVVNIDRSVQRMSVTVDGMPRYNWRVSTARSGYITPPGTYHPEMLARRWFSRKYYNSPMPHSIFFYGGFAIHGSYEISHLGRPASHGCVRLDPGNAAILFSLVQREGVDATTIVIH
jgi:lipoprotein-anchoring transpeptidase ErfK/SrfK